ncbi:MAG: hypothetical protein RR446_03590 [Lachnospiraceae bacterium]
MDNKHNPCDQPDYRYLLERFEGEKIEKRYCMVYDTLNDYIRQKGCEEKAIISSDILDNVIIDYFVDIDRLKQFSDIRLVNDIKIYAYLSYWILRHRPIQVICEERVPELAFVNEDMVVEFLETFLFSKPSGTPIVADKLEQVSCFENTLQYYLHYRDYTAKSIELILLAFNAGRGYQYSVDYQK